MRRYLPLSKVYSDKNTASTKNTAPPREYERQREGNFYRSGKLAVHGCKVNGRVKTELGECNLKVTRPDGECTEILVSNPGSSSLFVQSSPSN